MTNVANSRHSATPVDRLADRGALDYDARRISRRYNVSRPISRIVAEMVLSVERIRR
jgi:hypothetical protein